MNKTSSLVLILCLLVACSKNDKQTEATRYHWGTYYDKMHNGDGIKVIRPILMSQNSSMVIYYFPSEAEIKMNPDNVPKQPLSESWDQIYSNSLTAFVEMNKDLTLMFIEPGQIHSYQTGHFTYWKRVITDTSYYGATLAY